VELLRQPHFDNVCARLSQRSGVLSESPLKG
jgi:hypothetical protein